jgi:hypothetical protein
MTTNQMNDELKFKDENVKLVKVIADRIKSRTQSVKTLLIEKDGQQFVSLQKWWRRSADEPWEESKGFHFDPREAGMVINDLQTAVEQMSFDS